MPAWTARAGPPARAFPICYGYPKGTSTIARLWASEDRDGLDSTVALLEGLERRALGFFVERRSARPARMPTRLQLHVLHGIRESDGMALGELTGYLRVGPAAASQLAQTLVARGWLGRAPDPRDRRRRVFSVTATGSRVMAAMDRRHRLAVRRVLSLLSDEERAHLRAMAQHLYGLMTPGDRPRTPVGGAVRDDSAPSHAIDTGGDLPWP